MDGVAALRSVLIVNAPLVALVPAASIIAGPFGVGAPTKGISLKSISTTEQEVLAEADTRMVFERVQATVLAPDYPTQKAIMRALRKAASAKLYPAVTGITGVTIHLAGRGPDFMNEEASIYQGSQDFRVIYNEPT